jgi:hypothetical protein
VPEESNFEGSILKNWELLSDRVISGSGNGVVGLGSEVLGEIRLEKAKVHGEGQKELEFKMSYGDNGLNDKVVKKSKRGCSRRGEE